ncbi:mandelate racemase [Burkholderia multivorans]|uniref:enolase C-terminal domain-like protein n=1 Tax=Burkholderia ubonensis TaxID=101571 RepID=UPI000759F272|nr:enolase C-terminal domain-like protein [Burkholderia ubonensis]AYZ65089.1 mandelate racemase [Burkholderia multivorans]KUZ89308.1 mandelate racemase [Burkholderia ubonensis]VWB42153.1 mandelate racemase [Burkholderia ubonensis]
MRGSLRIAGVRMRTVSVPLEKPVRTAAGLVSTAALVIVDMDTDHGASGTTYAFTDTPVALGAIRRLLDDLAGMLTGLPVAPAALYATLRQRLKLLGTPGLVGIVLATLDMAAWDALARTLGVPLATLLGGGPGPVAAYASYGMAGVEQAERDGAEAMERGYRALKIKIGYPTLAEDLAAIRAVRRVVGDEVRVMVDYNQYLSVADALVRCAALDDERIEWIEEPTAYDDYAGNARIAAAIRTPVQLGENLWGPREVGKALAHGASDLMMLDLMKAGGVTGWLRGAALCDAAGVRVSSHVFPEVSAQLLRVTPGAHYLESLGIATPLLARPLRVVDGMAIVDDTPGSGIVWNDDAVARHLVD